MRVAVTGGDGFIGHHVVKRIKDLRHKVSVIDLKRGVDIRDRTALLDVMTEFRPDVVVHLAAELGKDANELYTTNVVGTANVVIASERCGVKKIVYTSSAAVYGNGVASEESRCYPISDYGLSKLLGEGFVLQTTIRDTVVFRLFNVYGEGGQGVVNVLSHCIETGKQFKMTSRAAVRDFVSVETVVGAVERVLMGKTGQLLSNVGTGQGRSVEELAKMAQTFGSFDIVDLGLDPPTEIRTSVADVLRFRSWFGEEPRGSVEEFWSRITEGG